MQKKLTILAPAKINLFLDVMGRRENGYHEILSVMQTIGIFDRVTITVLDAENGEQRIEVNMDNDAPDGEENTVYRAAEQFFKAEGIENFCVSFQIEKRIPQKAGLGGGSSDAAAAIIGLNELYGTEMTLEQMLTVAAAVGSDVPYCVKKGTCVVSGIGDVIQSCTPMPECVVVVAKMNGDGISTAEAYRLVDGVTDTAPMEKLIDALTKCSLEEIGRSIFNKFERVTPEETGVFELKQKLAACGSSAVMMTGTGSAVFALFDNVPSAKRAAEALSDIAETFVCRPVRRAYRFIE
ncbi:MAG: 4-(cytidine 5'-diphospho)-2-C-methyl-D-erythritol kinase [Clostridia bacterium]|nr:4-(cytidine 5'-diphospho)-2-C-methyl-D-erythritol kinase [Clostridia bacterium]